MDAKSTGLILGVLGMAHSIMLGDTAQAQITTCDDPNYSYCTIMNTPCGYTDSGDFIWCQEEECFEVCC